MIKIVSSKFFVSTKYSKYSICVSLCIKGLYMSYYWISLIFSTELSLRDKWMMRYLQIVLGKMKKKTEKFRSKIYKVRKSEITPQQKLGSL